MSKQVFVGIVGRNGSGKSTLCEYLESLGFVRLSLSSIVRDHVKNLGLKQERNTLISYANSLKATRGLDFFARETLQQATQLNHTKVVFDSIRNTSELNFLKSAGVTMIGIQVPIDIRFQRIQTRQHETDFVNFDEFLEQDRKESGGNSLGQDLDDTYAQCDYFIDNSSDLSFLKEQADKVLLKVKINTNDSNTIKG
jgi:dephospho-CoA kinase